MDRWPRILPTSGMGLSPVESVVGAAVMKGTRAMRAVAARNFMIAALGCMRLGYVIREGLVD